MSEATLQRHRGRFLDQAATANKAGAYRPQKLTRQGDWLPLSVAETLLYRASNIALRTALCALPSLAAQRDNAARGGRDRDAAVPETITTVSAKARACAKVSGQNAANVCLGWRELRILGLAIDNRPGRRLDPKSCEGSPRYPARVVSLVSPLVPLPADQIRSVRRQKATSRKLALQHTPAIQDPSIKIRSGSQESVRSVHSLGGTPACGSVDLCGASPGAADGDAEGRDGLDLPMKPSATTPAPASQPAPSETISDAQRLTPHVIRKLAVELGLVDAHGKQPNGCAVSDRACYGILNGLHYAGELRRAVGPDGRMALDLAELPVSYLAHVCRDEGRRVVARDWPGSHLHVMRQAARTTPTAIARGAARAAWEASDAGQAERARRLAETTARAVLTRYPENADMQRAAAQGLREAGDPAAAALLDAEISAREAADRWGAMAPVSSWPTFTAIAVRGFEAWDAKHWILPLRIKWRGVGEAVLVGPDESHSRWCAEHFAGPLAQHLADLDRHPWRLIFESPDGARCGVAEANPQQQEERSDERTESRASDAQPATDGTGRDAGRAPADPGRARRAPSAADASRDGGARLADRGEPSEAGGERSGARCAPRGGDVLAPQGAAPASARTRRPRPEDAGPDGPDGADLSDASPPTNPATDRTRAHLPGDRAGDRARDRAGDRAGVGDRAERSHPLSPRDDARAELARLARGDTPGARLAAHVLASQPKRRS